MLLKIKFSMFLQHSVIANPRSYFVNCSPYYNHIHSTGKKHQGNDKNHDSSGADTQQQRCCRKYSVHNKMNNVYKKKPDKQNKDEGAICWYQEKHYRS